MNIWLIGEKVYATSPNIVVVGSFVVGRNGKDLQALSYRGQTSIALGIGLGAPSKGSHRLLDFPLRVYFAK